MYNDTDKNISPEEKLEKRKSLIKLLNLWLDEENKKKRDAFMRTIGRKIQIKSILKKIFYISNNIKQPYSLT